MTLRHKCDKGGCYKEKYLPDWGILKGCFPRGIEPSDVDGIVEIDGSVLMLEWKPAPGALTKGQRIMFEKITGTCPNVRVLVIYGPKNSPTQIQLFQHGRSRFKQQANVDFLRWYCEEWGALAQKRKVA